MVFDANHSKNIQLNLLVMKKKLIFLIVIFITVTEICSAQNVLNIWDQPYTNRNNTFAVQVRKTGDTNWIDLSEYNVLLGRQAGTVYNSSMVNFDFNGSVDFKITYNNAAISSFDIRPTSYGINATQSGNILTFSVTQDYIAPRKIIVRINNNWYTEVLHILTNVPEIGAPMESDANVYVINAADPTPLKLPAGKNTYYFKPGIHILPKGLWVEADMGATFSINKLELFQGTYNGNVDKVKYIVEAKLNVNDPYTTIFDGTSNTAVGMVSQTFPATNARYVRLKLLGNNATGSYVFSSIIKEFSIYGSGSVNNLVYNKAIAGGGLNWWFACDGDLNTSYNSNTLYQNWHAGETFFIGQNNTTIYIAKGATLKGSIMSDGISNIQIKGRGWLDCSDLRHTPTTPASEGRTGAIWMSDGSDNFIEGITVLDPPMWSLVMNYSQSPTIKGVNLIGRAVNADGVHLSGSSNATVDGMFIRTCDDNLVMYHYAPASGNKFKNSVLWSDDAHIILIGLGGNAGGQPISDLRFENLDIIDQQGVFDLNKFNGCLKLWPNGDNLISNVIFDNIRIESFSAPSKSSIFQFRTDERYTGEGAGSIKDITVSNITYNGTGELSALLKGVNSSHAINNVNFLNYLRQSTPVTSASTGNITIETYVNNVNFNSDATLLFSENLALNKTSTSNQAMYTTTGANKATDGNIDTYAQSSARVTPWNLTIDLDTIKTFNKIVFKSGFSEYASVYSIEGSNSGSSWTTITSEAGSSGGIKTYNNFGYVNYRYVRLNPTSSVLSSGTSGHSIFEFEVYNDSSNSADLALYKNTLSNQPMFSGYDANKITDASYSTYAQASSRTTPWKFTTDLGSRLAFNRLVFTSGSTNYASIYTIEGSDDMITWNTLVNETGSTGGSKTYNNFGNLTYRYLRLNPTNCVLDTGGTYGYAVLKFEVYNDGGSTSWSRRNDNASATNYYDCSTENVVGYYLNDAHYADLAGSWAEFSFYGTGIRWIGKKDNNQGKADVFIDGIFQSTIDTYSSISQLQTICYEKTGLNKASHTMRVVVRNDKNTSSSGYVIKWDAFDYYSEDDKSPQNRQNSLSLDQQTHAQLNDIPIYPNPATDGVLIIDLSNISEDDQVSISIYDLIGQNVHTTNANGNKKVNILLKNLTPAMYLVRTTWNGGVSTKKIIVK